MFWVKLWFTGLEGFGFPQDAPLDKTSLEPISDQMRHDMRYLRRDDRLTIPFFAYYMNRIDQETPRRLRDNWQGTDQDMENLDSYLRRVISTLLSGTTVSQRTDQTLREDMLSMIFWTDARQPAILRAYQSRKSTS